MFKQNLQLYKTPTHCLPSIPFFHSALMRHKYYLRKSSRVHMKALDTGWKYNLTETVKSLLRVTLQKVNTKAFHFGCVLNLIDDAYEWTHHYSIVLRAENLLFCSLLVKKKTTLCVEVLIFLILCNENQGFQA